MDIKLDIRMDAASLTKFVLYHNYVRPGGIIGVLISIAAIVALAIRWSAWTGMQRCLLVILALLFIVFQPLMLIQKAHKQLNSESFVRPLHYDLSDETITVSQKQNVQSVRWDEVRKTVVLKNVMFIYTSYASAFIIPKNQCGEDAFDAIVKKCR